MKLSKLKNDRTGIYLTQTVSFWQLKSFELLSRITACFVVWGFVSSIPRLNEDASPRVWHDSIGLLFYILLFYIIGTIINIMAGPETRRHRIEPWLRLSKWLFLSLTIVLFILSSVNVDFSGGGLGLDRILYHMVYTCPAIVNSNTGYIVISFLAFYISRVIRINSKLKEEQSLTI